MRALVTGITGFVGHHLTQHLLSVGDQVLGMARGARWPVRTSANTAAVSVLAWDIATECPPAVDSAINQFAPQVIYHLAGMSVPDQCGADEPTVAAWAANVEGTARLIDLATRVASKPRLVLVSSSHVYAPAPQSGMPLDELAPVAPQRGYGKTKRAAELLLLQAIYERSLSAVVVRAFQHTGPGQQSPLMLPQWIEQLAARPAGPLEIYTSDAWIDLTDVRDTVRAYRLLACHAADGVTYNIGTGVPRRTGELVERLCQLAGCQPSVRQLRPAVRYDPIADASRAARDVGWRPEISIDKTLHDAWLAR